MCLSNAFDFVTGASGARVLRDFPGQIAGKVPAASEEGRFVKMERHAGKITL